MHNDIYRRFGYVTRNVQAGDRNAAPTRLQTLG